MSFISRSVHTKKKLLSGRIKRGAERWRTFPAALPGSLTVEAAAVLPIFLFAMVSLLSVSEIIRSSDIVSSRLHQNARNMAVSAYLTDKAGVSDGGGVLSGLGGIAISQTVVSSDVDRERGEESAREGSITYLRSKYLENDLIDLVATQEYTLPYDFMGIGRFRIIDRARVHAFTGYDPCAPPPGMEESEEEIVYITPTGDVYHKNRNCSHLNVSVRQISAASVESSRNTSGGKYYQCEFCASNGRPGVYYITDYGDRYHTLATCQGLKRDVTAVPISQVGGRRPCKTCSK